MQKYLLDPPFFLFGHQLVADWQRLSVLTAKEIFTRVTALQRYALHIPKIDGDSKPQWMLDVAQKIVVVKHDITHIRSFGACHTVANEFIAAAIGQHLHLRVPRVLIWERKYSHNRTVYFSVTPRVFPDCEHAPADKILMADKTLPAMPVFDAFILDGDGGRPLNIVYCKSSPHNAPLIAYLDKGLADLEGLNNYRNMDGAATILKFWYVWNPKIRQFIDQELSRSPVVSEVVARIENMPDHFIKDTVKEVPDALFGTPKSKQRIIDVLRRRRETIRKQVYPSFAVS